MACAHAKWTSEVGVCFLHGRRVDHEVAREISRERGRVPGRCRSAMGYSTTATATSTDVMPGR
jgi:hypothetical protein